MVDIDNIYRENYPKDWKLVPLRKVSTMNGRIGWQGLKQSEFTMNPDDPFLITGENFKEGKISWDEVYHIPTQRYEEAKPIQLKTGDVLMTKDGTIGKILFVDQIPYPGKASLNSHLLVFRPINNSYNSKFFFYQLESKKFKDHIELEKSGTTFFGITQEAVGKYEVFLPDLAEQTAIAQVLSDTDELISSLEKLIEKKKQIKQGTMQQLLTGKKRLPGFDKNNNIKKTGVGIIPKDWNLISFDEAFSFHPTAAYPREELTESDEVYYVHYGDIHMKWKNYLDFDTNSLPTISNKNAKGFAFIEEGDLIIVDASEDYEGIGASVEVKNIGTRKAIAGLHTFLLKTKNNTIVKGYKGYIQSNKIVKKQMDKLATGLKVFGVSRNNLKKVLIPIPPTKEEQTAIVEMINNIDFEIGSLELKLNKYKSIKQGMMQNLLTGKIRLV